MCIRDRVNRGSYGADITETISIFNWEPISLEKTLIDMSNSLKQIPIKWINNEVLAIVFTYRQIENFATINNNLAILIKENKEKFIWIKLRGLILY